MRGLWQPPRPRGALRPSSAPAAGPCPGGERRMQSASSEFPLMLGRAQLSQLMTPADHLCSADAAFRAHAQGRTRLPMPLYVEGDGGGLHAKGAYVALDRAWAAVKVNSNFPGNPAKGLPTIQGAVLLFDGTDGRLLAILD